MKRRQILCYGDSNTWGYDPQGPGRYDGDTRWTMRLQQLLGQGWLVQEAGLNSRTTVFDDPLGEGLSGLDMLLPTLLTHAPIDLLILMLGTNDCKERFSASPRNIADGLLRLVRKARQTEAWAGAPRILIAAPIVIDERLYHEGPHGPGMGAGCVEKSRALPALYRRVAQEQGCHYIDCNDHVKAAEGDFMHFDRDSHRRFAEALARLIPGLLAQRAGPDAPGTPAALNCVDFGPAIPYDDSNQSKEAST